MITSAEFLESQYVYLVILHFENTCVRSYVETLVDMLLLREVST